MELIIALMIVGILTVVGVPTLKTFMQNNRLIAASNELLASFHLARTEALKLNSRVTICESTDGTTCSTTGSWRTGWIVFVDADGNLNGTGTACAASGTDCLLRTHAGYSDPQLLITGIDEGGAAVSSITFTSLGLPKQVSGASQSGVFNLCVLDNGGSTINSRAMVLSLSGRVRISDNPAVITQCP